MSLAKYLRGIPQANLPAAINAAANSVYEQHIRLLRDATRLSNPSQIAEAYTEIEGLVEDAKALLETGVLIGHSLHKAKKVAELNLSTVMASLRFQQRHPIK